MRSAGAAGDCNKFQCLSTISPKNMSSKVGYVALRAAVTASCLVGLTTSTVCDNVEAREKSDNNRHTVAVYLTEESRKIMKRNLSKLGIKGDVDAEYVVIRRNCTSKDSYPYEPLFGERAAFRLKAIARTDDGTIAVGHFLSYNRENKGQKVLCLLLFLRSQGTGRVGLLNGELRDDEYEVSMPIVIKPNNDGAEHPFKSDIDAIDLPSRLTKAHVVGDKPFWMGRLVAGNVHGKSYPAVKATCVHVEKERQFVVDGYLCRSDFVDEHGACLFDRAVHMTQSLSDNDVHVKEDKEDKEDGDKPPAKSKAEAKPTKSGAEDTPKTEGEKAEEEDGCPVCRYMKAGPCKQEFLSWDGCIQSLKEQEDMGKCFEVTMAMMGCMREHEYYDMMTAGTGDKFEAAKQATDAGFTKEHSEETTDKKKAK